MYAKSAGSLGAHRVAGVKEAIEAKDARVEYLSPYSPDFNPIEKCWSKIKTALRKAKARTREALEAALKEALQQITEADVRGVVCSLRLPCTLIMKPLYLLQVIAEHR